MSQWHRLDTPRRNIVHWLHTRTILLQRIDLVQSVQCWYLLQSCKFGNMRGLPLRKICEKSRIHSMRFSSILPGRNMDRNE